MQRKRTLLVSFLTGVCLSFFGLGVVPCAKGGELPVQTWDFGIVPQKSEVSQRF